MNDEQALIEGFNQRMALLRANFEQKSQEVLVDALLGACGTIILLLTNKQASGLVLKFEVAQLAHDYITDSQEARAEAEALASIDPSQATMN